MDTRYLDLSPVGVEEVDIAVRQARGMVLERWTPRGGGAGEDGRRGGRRADGGGGSRDGYAPATGAFVEDR